MELPLYNCSAALNPCFGFGACRAVAPSDYRCFCDNSRTRFEADGTPSSVVSHPTCQYLDWEVEPDFIIYAGIPLGIANFVVFALAIGAMYTACKRKRLGANIQTLAISMLLLFGLTSMVTHLIDPYGARNMYPRPLDMVMVMLPHPCLATAYNLLLLLLRSLTGSGLAKTGLTMRTLVIGVAVTNGILFGLLMLCATMNVMQFYIIAFLLWITAFSVAFFIYTRRILKFLAGNGKRTTVHRMPTIVVRAQVPRPADAAAVASGGDTGPGRPRLMLSASQNERHAAEERESEFDDHDEHDFDSTGESVRSVTSGFSPVPPRRNIATGLAPKNFEPRSLALYVTSPNQTAKVVQLRQLPSPLPQLQGQPQEQLQSQPQLQNQPQPQAAATKPKVKRGRLMSRGSRSSRAQDKHSRLLARLGISSAVICLCVVVVMVYWALTVDTANVRITVINYYIAHWGANFWAGVVLWGFWPQKPAAKSRR